MILPGLLSELHALTLAARSYVLLLAIVDMLPISKNASYKLTIMQHSLVPKPRPAFHHLQYGKAGEGLVSFLT